MTDPTNKTESDFYEFARDELQELRHPYSSTASNYVLTDSVATARLFMAVLQYEVSGKEFGNLRKDFLEAFDDFIREDNKQANALKALGTACEAYIKKIAQMLGKHSSSVGTWALVGPDYLGIISDRDVAGGKHLTKNERSLAEDTAYWSGCSVGEALIYRARRTRNAANHGFEKANKRERQDRFYDLLGALLYITEKKTTELAAMIRADDARRTAIDVRELFEKAVMAWTTSRQPVSKEYLNLFYQHRATLSINEAGVLLLLESEINQAKRDTIFGVSVGSQRRWRIRWLDAVDGDACTKALESVLRSFDDGTMARQLIADSDRMYGRALPSLASEPEKVAQRHALNLVADLYSSPSIEFQRRLLSQLQSAGPQKVRELLWRAYPISYVQTDEVLAYLIDRFCSSHLSVEIQQLVAYRILEHYRVTFPLKWFHRRDDDKLDEWRLTLSQNLFASSVFQEMACHYLEAISTGEWRELDSHSRFEVTRFKIEMVKTLYDQNKTAICAALPRIVAIFSEMKDFDIELLQLWQAYDPDAAASQVSNELRRGAYLHHKSEVALLELMATPQTDQMLIHDLETYIQKLEGGSNRWTNSSSWCKDIRSVIAAIGRRRVALAFSPLVTIVTRDEPEYIKLSCLSAIAKIAHDEAVEREPNFDKTIKSLETMSQKDRSDKVRKASARAVKALKKADSDEPGDVHQ